MSGHENRLLVINQAWVCPCPFDQGEEETGALSRYTFRPQATSMKLNQVFGDRQA
jgi:hypothetical protein